MLRLTLAAAAAAILTSPAAAQRPEQLLSYTGQIRGQMALVRAQADLTFDSCPADRLAASRIGAELDRLCRELDRVEINLTRPIPTRQQMRLVERALHRLDDQAGDVDEAIHEALADPRRHGIEPRNAFLPKSNPIYYPGITTHTVGHRGMQVLVGGGRVSVSIGGSPTRVSHTTARPTGFTPPRGPSRNDAILCAATDDLRLMTRQLLALVCH